MTEEEDLRLYSPGYPVMGGLAKLKQGGPIDLSVSPVGRLVGDG